MFSNFVAHVVPVMFLQQGCINNINVLVGVFHSSDEPCILGDSDNMLNNDVTNPPIRDIDVSSSQANFSYMVNSTSVAHIYTTQCCALPRCT